jgi:hypothetical protein
MTTTSRTPVRNPQEHADVGPSQQELQAAYQVHTLAHMLYGQLATIYPWTQLHYVPPMGPVTMPWMQGQMPGGPVAPQGPPSYPWAGYGYGFYGSQFIPR